MESFRYKNDAPFWYMLAAEVRKKGEERLDPVFDALTRCAAGLQLPIRFGGEKSLAWAVICQLFLIYSDKTPNMARREYASMVSAFAHALTPPRFARVGMKRIIANITYPSSPNRTLGECVADTFLANGLSVTEVYDDASWDEIILSRSLSNPEMMALCQEAVTPPLGLWERVVDHYGTHRPGFFSRVSFRAKNWLSS